VNQTLEAIDALLQSWSAGAGGEEHRYPVLIEAGTLRRAEYPEAFPQLLMAPAVAVDPEQPFSDENAALSPWFLSPAVCYHTYAALAGQFIEGGEVYAARGHCFRNESAEELQPGRRQIEFQMRELVFVGSATWLEERLGPIPDELISLAARCGMEPAWCPANDPFFLPRARGKAQMQRLLGTKSELCLPCGLAIASINRHGPFFGQRFDIRLRDGEPAHTGCVAFGLDRWAAHATELSL
jgi:hypothetical protein